ncbi:hypothetical protein [Actinocorallia populi]|uniref:hypothetical protein n=1 Tax=Actinocorallia populi TaxID=2079200 RepID=UPI000D090C63|nr:hypothetical protein [Actinocorallia populi]
MDSTRAALATIAQTARDAYGPHDHMQVRSSGVVHNVVLTRWLAGELLPGPACMVGVSGWDPYAAHPVQGAVTCLRCLRLAAPAPPGIEQLELFDVA